MSSSRWPLCRAASIWASAFATMVRNLYIVKSRPFSPTRRWAKMTGRPVSSQTARAENAITGAITTRVRSPSTRSNTRLTTRSKPVISGARTLIIGMPQVSSAIVRPGIRSKTSGTTRMRTSARSSASTDSRSRLWACSGSAMITSSGPCRSTSAGRSSTSPSTGRPFSIVSCFCASSSANPNHLVARPRPVDDEPGHAVADGTGAGDQHQPPRGRREVPRAQRQVEQPAEVDQDRQVEHHEVDEEQPRQELDLEHEERREERARGQQHREDDGARFQHHAHHAPVVVDLGEAQEERPGDRDDDVLAHAQPVQVLGGAEAERQRVTQRVRRQQRQHGQEHVGDREESADGASST